MGGYFHLERRTVTVRIISHSRRHQEKKIFITAVLGNTNIVTFIRAFLLII